MAMKAPTPEEVVALVTAATAPDGTIAPAMQELLMQMQAQQTQAQAQVQAQAQAQAQSTSSSTTSVSSTQAKTAPTAAKTVNTTATELMPLPATVVIGSPTSGVTASSVEPVHTVVSGEATGASTRAPTKAVKRKSIPLSMKKEAIEWIMGPGKGIPSRAEKHFCALNWDVSASSFRKWWKNREKIMGDSSNKKRITGGGRKPYLEDSEEKLLVVVIQERAKKDRVTRKWIAKTAQHMFQRSNTTFKASENWVTKFIRRNGLTLKRSYVTCEPQPSVDHQQAQQRAQQALQQASGAQNLNVATTTTDALV